MPEIIERIDAHTKGLRKYFTGRPCKYGHTAERYVSNGMCTECFRTPRAFSNARNVHHDHAPFILSAAILKPGPVPWPEVMALLREWLPNAYQRVTGGKE